MNITALDLSLTAIGYADTGGRSGVYAPKCRGADRLADIAEWLSGIAHRPAVAPDLVVIEGYAHGRSHRNHQIGEAGGVVRYLLHVWGVPFVEVPPSSLKRFATGRGNASKALVLTEAVRRLGYEGSSDDEADALWLLAMARKRYQLPGAPALPKTHLKGLEKLPWPEEVAL